MVADRLPDAAEVESLNAEFANADPASTLRWALSRFNDRVAIGTSFQASGLVILHHAHVHHLPLRCFTIDTGLLFPETIALRDRVTNYFGIEIEVLRPELSLGDQARDFGPELWARRPDTCCTVRKVIPLQAHLLTLDGWVTGLRRDQSAARQRVQRFELYRFDPVRDKSILKINPLADWSRDRVWAYVREHEIPFNPLAQRGFQSIGCQPCTRPVGDHEGERAGRWTGFEKTECGIHTFMEAHV